MLQVVHHNDACCHDRHNDWCKIDLRRPLHKCPNETQVFARTYADAAATSATVNRVSVQWQKNSN